MNANEYVYGIHAVMQFLHSRPADCRGIYFVKKNSLSTRLQEIQQLANKSLVNLHELDDVSFAKQFPQLTTVNHQGVVLQVAIRHLRTFTIEEIVKEAKQPLCFLLLDCITDPHNLGACLRSAEAAGVDAVIIPKDKSVGLTDVVRKVACGAAEMVPLISVTNLARTMEELKERGIWIIGMDAQADKPLYAHDLTGSIAIVMGSEGEGMRQLTRKNCDFLAAIPMVGSINSLNVSVATGIALFEVVRQRSI